MKPKQRRAEITDLIRQQGRVSVEQLAREFDTSVETIRRDLSKLSKTGKIQKIHGGAILPIASPEGPIQLRMDQNIKAKRQAAKTASELIQPGDTLFIDTGSSTLCFAEEVIRIAGLTVVTNSPEIANVVACAECDAQVFLLGGEFDAHSRETTGVMTIAQLDLFHADHAVLATAALDATAGFMSFDFGEAQLARAMLARANNTVVLADTSKFNRTASFTVGQLGQIDQLVCEAAPDGELLLELEEQGVAIKC